ncbi:MAG: ABC transporter substrate-binding protein [Deltaproteobacteria bacterium]|nr:ABC transporter substrate-binding protein [Deltaproteobacteria bacterium]
MTTRLRIPATVLFASLLFVLAVSAGAVEAPRPLAGVADAIPVLRPGTGESSRTAPIVPFLQAESEYAAGRADEALSGFLDLAYSAADDERKGFIWWRVGELLLVRGELDKALEAADKAVLLSRAPYLSLSAVDLKLRIYQRMKWNNEARQMAAYLLDRKFVNADPPALLALMARVDAGAGKLGSALALYRRAVAAASDPQVSLRLSAEREMLIDGATDLSVLRGAAEGEEDPEVRGHLYFSLGNAAIRKGFLGMAAHAFERSARAGGKWSSEAAERLFRAERIIAVRPRIVGLVPLSGRLSDIGYAVLTGAEVALKMSTAGYPREGSSSGSGVALGALHGLDLNSAAPVIRWVDTAGQPEKARKEFVAAAADRMVLGFLGPVTGEEGRSVGAAFTQKSPPTLYLGQKPIFEKPFLYGFGLSPAQEARALFSYLARAGVSDLLLFHPENGYGNGFTTAAAAAAVVAGIRIAKTVSYSPETQDFTEVIKRAVGNATFQRQSRSKEKGKAMTLPLGGIVIADRWDRVFLLASQLRYYNVYLPLAGFSGWNDTELLRRAVGSVSGAVFPVDYSDVIPGPQGDRFRKAFQEMMRVPPSRFEAMGYDGAMFLSEAFATEGGSGRPLGEAMREKIPRLKNYPGVTGTFQFTPAGDLRRKVSLLQVELGNFVPVPTP